MESTYVNTGHPDFLNGHRAMALVNERQAAAKPTHEGHLLLVLGSPEAAEEPTVVGCLTSGVE
jgi:hypothetical protein